MHLANTDALIAGIAWNIGGSDIRISVIWGRRRHRYGRAGRAQDNIGNGWTSDAPGGVQVTNTTVEVRARNYGMRCGSIVQEVRQAGTCEDRSDPVVYIVFTDDATQVLDAPLSFTDGQV